MCSPMEYVIVETAEQCPYSEKRPRGGVVSDAYQSMSPVDIHQFF